MYRDREDKGLTTRGSRMPVVKSDHEVACLHPGLCTHTIGGQLHSMGDGQGERARKSNCGTQVRADSPDTLH